MLNIVKECVRCNRKFNPIDSDQELCFECEEELMAIEEEERYYQEVGDL